MEKSLVENGNDTIPTPQQIENRWKSMTHQFKKTAEHNNISGNNRKNCRYYEELNDIMGFRPNVKPVSIVGTIKRRNEVITVIVPYIINNLVKKNWPVTCQFLLTSAK